MSKKGKVRREKIYRRIEDEQDIPRDKIREAVKHQFSRTAELMASGNRETGDFPSVRLPYFGKFYVKEKRWKHLQESNNDSNSDN